MRLELQAPDTLRGTSDYTFDYKLFTAHYKLQIRLPRIQGEGGGLTQSHEARMNKMIRKKDR